MERFTIGQMAEVNHCTKKTLMIYHKHGLLVPEDVDPQTGYRYYSLNQCSTLDMIQQLKQVGLSLSQIRDVMEHKDIAYMQSLIRDQITRMRQEMAELELSLSTARGLVSTCDTYLSKPTCYDISLEYIPRRRALFYGVAPYVVQKEWVENPGLSNWEKSLRSIKQQLLDDGYPLVLFHNVGCVVSRESLSDRNFLCTGGYIFCPRPMGEHEISLEEGYCLCATIDRTFDENGRHLENLWMNRLMDVVEEQGYTVRGDYTAKFLPKHRHSSIRGEI